MGRCLGEGLWEHSEQQATEGWHSVSPHASQLHRPDLAHGHNGHEGDVPSSLAAWETAGEQLKPTVPLSFFAFFG